MDFNGAIIWTGGYRRPIGRLRRKIIQGKLISIRAAVYDGKSERSINNGLDRIDAPPVYEVPFVYPLSVPRPAEIRPVSVTRWTRPRVRIIYRSIFPALEVSFDTGGSTTFIPPFRKDLPRKRDTSSLSLSLSHSDFRRVEKSVSKSSSRFGGTRWRIEQVACCVTRDIPSPPAWPHYRHYRARGLLVKSMTNDWWFSRGLAPWTEPSGVVTGMQHGAAVIYGDF